MESDVGINVTNSALTTGSDVAPTVTLGRDQFENAVAEIAAQLIWLGASVKLFPQLVYLAGHLDTGCQPANGTSEVTDAIVQLQLNIIKLAFALGASTTLFLLLFYIIGVMSPRSLPVSQWIHDRMLEVDDPSLDNLRRARKYLGDSAQTVEYDEIRSFDQSSGGRDEGNHTVMDSELEIVLPPLSLIGIVVRLSSGKGTTPSRPHPRIRKGGDVYDASFGELVLAWRQTIIVHSSSARNTSQYGPCKARQVTSAWTQAGGRSNPSGLSSPSRAWLREGDDVGLFTTASKLVYREPIRLHDRAVREQVNNRARQGVERVLEKQCKSAGGKEHNLNGDWAQWDFERRLSIEQTLSRKGHQLQNQRPVQVPSWKKATHSYMSDGKSIMKGSNWEHDGVKTAGNGLYEAVKPSVLLSARGRVKATRPPRDAETSSELTGCAQNES
ncbi:hypothetical protein OG21DRAFT_1523851 [Imleria badia]|nr:hypothetical protein OG21DRAFT_1523851 [Imleria badia]